MLLEGDTLDISVEYNLYFTICHWIVTLPLFNDSDFKIELENSKNSVFNKFKTFPHFLTSSSLYF